MTSPRPRRSQDDAFTLIELMVVVLIIGILIAIAIPTFLGAQNRAKNRAAQSDLRNALTAARTATGLVQGAFLNSAGTVFKAADLLLVEPALKFDDTASTVGIARVATVAGGTTITLEEKSAATNVVYGISSTSKGVVTFCKGAAAGDCISPASTTPGLDQQVVAVQRRWLATRLALLGGGVMPGSALA